MADTRVEKLADLLVNYSIAAKPGQKIAIHGSTLAEPLIRALYASILNAGAHPTVLATLPGLDEILYRHGSDEQLQHVPPPFRLVTETYDGLISLMGAANTRSLTNVPAAKMALSQRATGEMTKTFMKRQTSGWFIHLWMRG